MGGWAIALTLLAADVGKPKALLYEPVDRDLASSIAIQLSRVVDVISAPALEVESRTDRIESIQTALRAGGAEFGIWVETSSAPPGAIAFIVRNVEGPPMVETASVAGVSGADLERALALKLLEVVEPRPVVSVKVEPPEVLRAPGRFRFSVELGIAGAVHDEARAQAGGIAAIGGRFEADGWLAELRTGAQVVSSLGVEKVAGTLELREWSWSAGIRGLLRIGWVWAGVGLDGHVRVLRAEARTSSGAEGRTSVLLPSFTGGLELRVPIWEQLAIRFFVGAGINGRQRLFGVNEMPLLDLGRWYGTAQLSLLFSIP